MRKNLKYPLKLDIKYYILFKTSWNLKMNNLLLSNNIYSEFSLTSQSEQYNNNLGTYNTDDFTIRLAYYIHEKLDNLTSGITNSHELDDDTLQAYSTFLHETIHWRQHIGSISGFILSMMTPSQNFCLHSFLKVVIDEIGPVKSLRKYYINNVTTNTPEDKLFKNLNNILNNFYDINYYKYLIINPEILSTNIHLKDEFFLSYGHSTIYSYINLLEILSKYFNDQYDIDDKIEKLKNVIYSQSNSLDSEYNAFKDEQIIIPPLGLKQIFEGQARFIQLQFLYFANRNTFDIPYFESNNLLNGLYGEAFDLYIKLIEHDYPHAFNSPLISIFLVICDLSINPGVAFPLDVGHDESFFFEAIPGIRFYELCCATQELLLSDENFTVHDHSNEEYHYIANALCTKLQYCRPDEILDAVTSWPKSHGLINEIINEEKDYSYKTELLPIRFLLSKFILACEDKKKYPEFFCWTGACSAGVNLKEEYSLLTERHKSPFISQKDLDVYASYREGISEDKIETMKDHFTAMNILSNLIKQWIANEGEFDVGFIKEINAKHSKEDLKKAYSSIFKNHFNFDFDDFNLI